MEYDASALPIEADDPAHEERLQQLIRKQATHRDKGGKASEGQSARFIEAARQLGTDEDPERFKETMRKLASAPVARNAGKPTKPKKDR